jgi:hypothetical protein
MGWGINPIGQHGMFSDQNVIFEEHKMGLLL